VGSTLLIGLKLLGKDLIDEIGIYDLDQQKMQRWEHELNQICYPQAFKLPEVNIINEGDLFNCDMFVFTASKFVPKVGSKTKDVRMAQFEANADIVRHYASMAKDQAFKGIFSVVSDPVDLLCNVVLEASNLKPSQIKGYGLGVMNGRANYYSQQMDLNYEQEGRVFGPHGKGLVVANSIENYNNDLSNTLTQQVVKANLAIRALGYKPYIAPALSSGALSIVETLKGNWQYSTVFINGIYWGVKNRSIHNSVQIETLDLPEILMDRIKESYKELKEHYENNKDT
jgi:malate/lactate dehydrogenase